MGQKTYRLTGAAIALALLGFAQGCAPNPGENLPLTYPDIPAKLAASGQAVQAACYIDTARYSPLNAGDYALEDGTLLFDLVILEAAEIRKDGKGVYLFIPPELQKVLDGRLRYIRPLQEKGMKALLGITGGRDDFSLGSLDWDVPQGEPEDERDIFCAQIKGTLDNYLLDGAEFYDSGAGKSGAFYPGEAEPPLEEDELEEAWRRGGDILNNLIYALRKTFGSDDKKYILLREENFGRYIPQNVSGSAGEATFSGSAEQINYFINPYFDRFVEESVQFDYGAPFISNFQYAPFGVNLAAPAEAAVIEGFSERFNNDGACDYGLLYCRNLRPVSEAASDPAFPALPGGGGPDTRQADYLSITTSIVFGRRVLCSGGDHLKEW